MSEITKDRTNALRTEPFARLFFYRQNEDFQVALYLLILLNLNEDEVSGILCKYWIELPRLEVVAL